jgi:hypothetical protein
MKTIKYAIIDGRKYEIRFTENEGLTISTFRDGKEVASYAAGMEEIEDSKNSAVLIDLDVLVKIAVEDLYQGIVK